MECDWNLKNIKYDTNRTNIKYWGVIELMSIKINRLEILISSSFKEIYSNLIRCCLKRARLQTINKLGYKFAIKFLLHSNLSSSWWQIVSGWSLGSSLGRELRVGLRCLEATWSVSSWWHAWCVCWRWRTGCWVTLSTATTLKNI